MEAIKKYGAIKVLILLAGGFCDVTRLQKAVMIQSVENPRR